MKRYFKLILPVLFIFLVSGVSVSNTNKSNNEWKLVWTDNFSGNQLDTTVWGYMKRSRDQSRKYHSSNPLCYDFRNGKLIIKGIINPDRNQDTASYLTGAITTQGKKAFAPGKIEIRAKLNNAKGAWPAFWMLPFKRVNGWPADGEIDIMEHLNYDGFVHQTVHSAFTKANSKALPLRTVKAKIKSDEFNIYGVSVEQDKVTFYLNGQPTLIYPKETSYNDSSQYPFYHDWYLMLDMQLGGSWVGKIDNKDLPVEMEIDWVKYYQKKQ